MLNIGFNCEAVDYRQLEKAPQVEEAPLVQAAFYKGFFSNVITNIAILTLRLFSTEGFLRYQELLAEEKRVEAQAKSKFIEQQHAAREEWIKEGAPPSHHFTKEGVPCIKTSLKACKERTLKERELRPEEHRDAQIGELAPLTSADGKSWRPFKVEEGEALEGQLVTNSERELGNKRDLINVYAHPDYGITTGLIDKEEKAEQFVAVVKKVWGEGKMRISLHQHNCFAVEKKMISSEHRMAEKISEGLKDGELPICTHQNSTLNAFSTNRFTRGWEKGRNRSLNREAVALRSLWFLEDRGLLESHGSEVKEKLKALYQARKGQEKELVKQAKKELKVALRVLANQLKEKQGADFTLATHLIAINLGEEQAFGFATLSVVQELALELLFDRSIHAITQINCKSGLNRTGFVRALHVAVQECEKTKGLQTAYDLLIHFEERRSVLDKKMQQARKDAAFDFSTFVQGLEGDDLAVFEMQRAIFSELMGVAMPVSARSWGKEGLSWSHKNAFFADNLHPISFLPARVLEADGQSSIPLFKFNLFGQRSTYTSQGRILFQGSSER